MVITLNGAVLFTTGEYELLPIAKTKLDEVRQGPPEQGFKKIVIKKATPTRAGTLPTTTRSARSGPRP